MKDLIERLKEGIEIDGRKLLRARVKKGRFAQELNLDLYLDGRSLLHAKLFLGRGPYREWVELFGLSREIYGTDLEGKILDLFSPYTGRLFIEYFEDLRTAEELKRGVPPALSRLGFELAKRGFTYVRDWYIPEGLMEGGHKLQGERAESEDVQEKRFKRLEEELGEFLRRSGDEELKNRALERFKILQSLWRKR